MCSQLTWEGIPGSGRRGKEGERANKGTCYSLSRGYRQLVWILPDVGSLMKHISEASAQGIREGSHQLLAPRVKVTSSPTHF